MKILRRPQYRAMPWKNGGGITHEIARMPEQGEAFEWRLSMARIGQSGPFSDFSGYLRIMLLLEGDGFVLHSPGEPDRRFLPQGEAQRFDGALPIRCELLGGACTDLNLMVRERCEVSTRTIRVDAPFVLDAQGALILFALQGPCLLGDEAREIELAPWDTALAAPGERITVRPSVHPAEVGKAPAALFTALVR